VLLPFVDMNLKKAKKKSFKKFIKNYVNFLKKKDICNLLLQIHVKKN